MKLGRLSIVHTARGTVVRTRFAVVSAVIPSHDPFTLEPNKKYPRQLQPRDRERITSEQQIEAIARNLRPELLGDSFSPTDGSPIVGPDSIVESGNARAMAILRAYSYGGLPAKKYRHFVQANLAEFGLSPKGLPLHPIVVRVRQSKVKRYQFVVEANESATASMSDAEQARIDATRLDKRVMALYKPGDDDRSGMFSGTLFAEKNSEFVRAFFNQVVASAERGRYIDASGLVSQQGVKRLRNALLAKAFGGTSQGFWVLERVAESTEVNVLTILNVLIAKTPKFVAIKQAIAEGHRFDLDITDDIVAALRKWSDLKTKNQWVEDYLKQPNFLGEETDELQALILSVFGRVRKVVTRVSRQVLEDTFDRYLTLVDVAGDPKQLSVCPLPVPTKIGLFQEAFDEAIKTNETGVKRKPAPRKRSNNKRSKAA